MKQHLILVFIFVGASLAVSDEAGVEQAKEFMLQYNKLPVPNVRVPDTETKPEEVHQSMDFDTCGECRLIVGRLAAILKDPAKLEHVKKEMSRFCNLLPGSYKSECQEIVDNLDKIVKEFGPSMGDAAAVCKELQLCESGQPGTTTQFAFLYAKKFLNKVEQPASRSLSADVCSGCQKAVQEMSEKLSSKSHQNDLKKWLESLCPSLGRFEAQCKAAVGQWSPVIVRELEHIASQSVGVCRMMALCESEVPSVQGFQMMASRLAKNHKATRNTPRLDRFKLLITRLQTKRGFKVGCVMCKIAFGTLITALKDDKALIAEVAGGIEGICKAFPAAFQPGCYDFLGIYLQPVITLTLEQFSGSEICGELHICDAHDARLLEMKSRSLKDEVVCEACKTLAGFLKFEFSEKAFQDEITNRVKQVCSEFPGNFATYCDSLVDQYVLYALKMLVENLTPSKICPELHLCH